MKTFMENSATVSKKWVVVDASDIPLGRLASQVASILRGKNKPTFTPHVDCGDYVIVINSDKVALTGNKPEDKYHYRVSTRPGQLKKFQYKVLLEEQSDEVVRLAVKGMLPKTRLGRKQITKLKVYKGAEHEQTAQKPVAVKLVGGRR